MKYKIYILLIIILAVNISCKTDKDKKTSEETKGIVSGKFDDSNYVLNPEFKFGDARRYGVTAKDATKQHPFTKKNRLETALDIAEETGEEISFPKGYYNTNLVLNNRSNIKLRFNSSEFSLIHIVQSKDSLKKPTNISLTGSITAYSSLGIVNADDIKIDSIFLKSDTKKNLWGLRNAGCHVYHGCKDIKINYLEVQDLGSGGEKYKYTHAALAIDGWNNNPENVQIKEIYIKSTDRHGIYITGKDHLIGKVTIDKFGIGSSDKMDGMQDSAPGEEKDFKALWVNKCYDSFIENITINEKGSKGKYTAHFDFGDKQRPFTISTLKVINDNPKYNLT